MNEAVKTIVPESTHGLVFPDHFLTILSVTGTASDDVTGLSMFVYTAIHEEICSVVRFAIMDAVDNFDRR